MVFYFTPVIDVLLSRVGHLFSSPVQRHVFWQNQYRKWKGVSDPVDIFPLLRVGNNRLSIIHKDDKQYVAFVQIVRRVPPEELTKVRTYLSFSLGRGLIRTGAVERMLVRGCLYYTTKGDFSPSSSVDHDLACPSVFLYVRSGWYRQRRTRVWRRGCGG